MFCNGAVFYASSGARLYLLDSASFTSTSRLPKCTKFLCEFLSASQGSMPTDSVVYQHGPIFIFSEDIPYSIVQNYLYNVAARYRIMTIQH